MSRRIYFVLSLFLIQKMLTQEIAEGLTGAVSAYISEVQELVDTCRLQISNLKSAREAAPFLEELKNQLGLGREASIRDINKLAMSAVDKKVLGAFLIQFNDFRRVCGEASATAAGIATFVDGFFKERDQCKVGLALKADQSNVLKIALGELYEYQDRIDQVRGKLLKNKLPDVYKDLFESVKKYINSINTSIGKLFDRALLTGTTGWGCKQINNLSSILKQVRNLLDPGAIPQGIMRFLGSLS